MVFQWFYYNDRENNPALQLNHCKQSGTNGVTNKRTKKIDHNILKNIIKMERTYDFPERIYTELTEHVDDNEEPYPQLTQLEILPSHYCPKCRQEYDTNDYSVEMVHCDMCTRWLHRECENITREVYIRLESLPRYECTLCKEWKLIYEKCKIQILKSNRKRNIKIGKALFIDSAFGNLHENAGTAYSSDFPTISSDKLPSFLPGDEPNEGNTAEGSQMIGDGEKCFGCRKIGATVKCVFCKKNYFHIRCLKTVLVCDLTVPTCFKHRITYQFPYVGINTGLRYNNYVYYSEEWYGVIINEDFLERRGDYLYLNDEIVRTSMLCKMYGKESGVGDMSLEQLFGLDRRVYTYFMEKCRNRPGILTSDLFDANIEEMKRFLNEKLEYSSDIISCSSSNAIKMNPTLTHLVTHLRHGRPRLSKSAVEGYGLFSTRLYDKDEPIIEYTGELIGDEEADRRERVYQDRIYMFRKNSKIILDATVVGNLAKYINHSCEPNCYATKVICGTASRIIICAKRIITKNEELSYDYNLSKGAVRFECRCNSSNCRRTFD
ncbi:hypothetical protein VCUG_01413 [Vavraia culicis subsp. floridensis]|uniref:SET domain-containing protein n=1 Tax=Vavraia culicis (isolate floridensis) TaxID=948595 RepID=L2GVK4_VAVCU|nr:uncharacterized protein VCUG_01413 [Vavraia culicis subsp. floridensis]ELA47140.1 hypothetical protein VCUG_01413 [Vavraia culicis subsp. floridensis]